MSKDRRSARGPSSARITTGHPPSDSGHSSREERALEHKRLRLQLLQEQEAVAAQAVSLERGDGGRRRSPWLGRFIYVSLVCATAAVGLGYYGYTVRGQRDIAQVEMSKARSAAATCNAERIRQTAKRTATQGKLDQCTTSLSQLNATHRTSTASMASIAQDLNASKQELGELRKQRAVIAKRLAAFKDMTGKFRKMIDSGKLDVVVRDGRMVVKLPAGVLFPSGSAELSRAGELALMEVAIVLRGFPDRRFMVMGHTDNRPLEASEQSQYKDNWDLSAARAVRVTRFMMEAKLDPKNLVAAGRGEFDPVADNRTRSGRQANRRIEIVLLPNIEELPPMPDTAPSDKDPASP